ncbi:putative [histone H3]-dimethyl-L-lysine(36) demethylase chromatin regulator PHD family [Helianthus anomalus]
MGKRKHNTLKEYIFDQNTIITSGDCILVETAESVKPEVARVNQIYKQNKKGKMVFDITWYLWPDDTTCGRLVFQGKNELLSSNWNDTVTADSIIGKCTVHTFDIYEKLKDVGPNDFFSRSKYNHFTKAYDPEESLPVYCVCRWPYNPDYPMICCGKCNCWFHPSCMGVKSISEVMKLDDIWFCQSCK